MQHRLDYGKEYVTIELPQGKSADIITYNEHIGKSDQEIVQAALEQPIGAPKLAELAKHKHDAVILISDMTRLCPSHLFLEYLLRELNTAGIPDQRIRIVVALGMHRKQTVDELLSLVGTSVYERVKVTNHSALPEDCVQVGTTSRGTPIEINRAVVEADLRIATGNIEPHRLVGMSGGVKALVPGVASQRCIEQHHSLSQKYKIEPGYINNPIHKDLEEALVHVPIHYLFNIITNHRKQLIDAVSGDVIAAHREGVEKAKKHFIVPVSAKYDVVVTSPGGFPKDLQLYQATKSIQNAAAITKPGGSILLVAHCGEIFGNGIFQYWVETIQDRKKIVDMLKHQFVLGAHKIEHIDKVLSKHKVYLFSSIPDSITELIGFIPVRNVQDTINELLSRQVDVAIMPYGAITFPQTNSST